ncbi:hypothetical protein pipiens_014722 [Culex pipiens pipiens]|uniref:Uncharacterized protein n=1 Tax=Culex pipiens pipiens TaxID=38569 RepID=A0ABD1CTD9_CULPP
MVVQIPNGSIIITVVTTLRKRAKNAPAGFDYDNNPNTVYDPINHTVNNSVYNAINYSIDHTINNSANNNNINDNAINHNNQFYDSSEHGSNDPVQAT